MSDPLEALRAAWGRLEAPGHDAPDARTQQVVAWMAAAYANAEPRSRVRRPSWWRTLAAAALVLLLLGAPLFLAPRAHAPDSPRVVALLPDRVELCSGPVQLVLLTSPPSEIPQ